ncbi:MAG: hypothetical protein IKZ98_05625 [Clostridia bacterium]|nr:hypothetical protein [Clostridia bacterium]
MQWRRIFCSRGFWFAIIIQIFAYLYGHMDTSDFWTAPLAFFAHADLLYFFLVSRICGLCIILLPFVAVLPASCMVAEDIQSGYIRSLLQRTGVFKYYRTRMLQAITGSAVASLSGSFLYFIFLMIASPWNDKIVISWREAMDMGSYASLANTLYGFPVVFETISRFCIEAMTWSLIGFSFSCWYKNTGLALALTFMCHYGITYILERFSNLYRFSPSFIAVPVLTTSSPLSFFYIMQFAYLGIALGIALIAAVNTSKTLTDQITC